MRPQSSSYLPFSMRSDFETDERMVRNIRAGQAVFDTGDLHKFKKIDLS